MAEDLLTSEQWAQRTRRHATPVESLWLAVLIEAVCLASGTRSIPNDHGAKRRQRAHDEAQEWIAGDGNDIGSFRWTCDALGLDADWIRRELGHTEPTRLRQVVNFLHTVGRPGARKVA